MTALPQNKAWLICALWLTLYKTGKKMNIAKSIEIVKKYGSNVGLTDFLEILQEMSDAFEDLWEREQIAYRVVVSAGQKMFAPKGE